MAKGKRIKQSIIDFAAKLIDKNDVFQEKLAKNIVYFGMGIENLAAAFINGSDNIQERFSRLLLILHYNTAKYMHEKKKKVNIDKRKLVHNAGVLFIVATAMVTIYSNFTCFEYSYNGKVLGYIKEQEDVNRILDLASSEISKEYSSKIKIDPKENISFKRVSKTDRTLDTEDQVLRKFTYLSDIKSKGSAIMIDGKQFVICSSKDDAENTLEEVQKKILGENDLSKYSKVGFKQKVKIKEVDVPVTSISSMDQAVARIMDGGIKKETYEIQDGDTIFDLCMKFDISMDEFFEMNPEIKESQFIAPGDVISLTKIAPALTVITVETSTFAEPIPFETEYKDDSDLYIGDERIAQEGADGKQSIRAKLTKENGKIVKRKDLSKEVIQAPVKQIVLKGTTERPKTAATGHLIFPVPGGMVTSEFGYRWGRTHTGLDIAGHTGLPIRAADGGTVVNASYSGGYGLCIDIDHGNGMKTRYAHCSSVTVSVGSKVYQGQYIGNVGNTGNSTGPHCHFEVIVNGSHVNPRNYL